MQKLYLVRGLPGSGKSTLAKTIVNDSMALTRHIEADDFRMINGKYVYDKSKNSWCHAKCLEATENWLRASHDVVVANTFMRRDQLQPYYALVNDLEKAGYKIQIFELLMCGAFKDIHNVPPDQMQKLAAEFEL